MKKSFLPIAKVKHSAKIFKKFSVTAFLLAIGLFLSGVLFFIFSSPAAGEDLAASSSITVDSNDGQANDVTQSWGTSYNEIAVESDGRHGAFRFTNLGLPDNIIITDARIQLEANVSRSGTFNIYIAGFKEVSSPQISSYSDWQGRTKTDRITWTQNGFTGGILYNSAGISAIVQEIYNLGERNIFQFTLDSGQPTDVKFKDSRSTANDPRLYITYAPTGQDIEPPLRSNGQPSGALPGGTTQTTISLSTNEPATCKYSETAGVSYDLMGNTFSSTGSTYHSTQISGLADGNSYAYYIKCIDLNSNANTDDFLIQFNVGSRLDN